MFTSPLRRRPKPITCHHTGIKGQKCPEPATYTATWPLNTAGIPFSANFCRSHVLEMEKVPNCQVTRMED